MLFQPWADAATLWQKGFIATVTMPFVTQIRTLFKVKGGFFNHGAGPAVANGDRECEGTKGRAGIL